MKNTAAGFVMVITLLFAGCGGTDVGGVPIDVGGLSLNFGDINLGGEFEAELLDSLAEELFEDTDDTENTATEDGGDTDEMSTDDEGDEDVAKPHPADVDGSFTIENGELLAYGVQFQGGVNADVLSDQDKDWLDVAVSIWQASANGAYFDDMESPEPFNWRAIVDDEQPDQPEPHPADTNADFLLAGEEVLAYALSFQNGELPEDQGESWLDVAVSIWQARADGAYFDDMESPEPLNWKSMDESGVVVEDNVEVVNDTPPDESEESEDTEGEGYAILFKVTPLSPVSFDLTVIDPTGSRNSDYSAPVELGWVDGTAWDGFYRVQVYAGSNYNNVNEQVRFLISVYKNGILILEEEYSVAEGSLWDDLDVAYP